MKHFLFFLTFFFITTFSFSQDRIIARGADPGELYLGTYWYIIWSSMGPPFCEVARTAVYRITRKR
jgi:hypothetical protein